jgi:hypothetical protein
MVGMRKKANAETKMIEIAKKEKMLFTKSRSAWGLSASFSIMNGIKTDNDTTDATVTKIKSGIRKAA